MLCLQWCWGDAIMRLWFDELRVRKEELAKFNMPLIIVTYYRSLIPVLRMQIMVVPFRMRLDIIQR